jgi:hypothetical protein
LQVLFFKRMPGVVKKAAELHELCGAEVGIYVRFGEAEAARLRSHACMVCSSLGWCG